METETKLSGCNKWLKYLTTLYSPQNNILYLAFGIYITGLKHFTIYHCLLSIPKGILKNLKISWNARVNFISNFYYFKKLFYPLWIFLSIMNYFIHYPLIYPLSINYFMVLLILFKWYFNCFFKPFNEAERISLKFKVNLTNFRFWNCVIAHSLHLLSWFVFE